MTHAHDMVATHVANGFSKFSNRRNYSKDFKEEVKDFMLELAEVAAEKLSNNMDEYDHMLYTWAYNDVIGDPLAESIEAYYNNIHDQIAKNAIKAASTKYGVTLATCERWHYEWCRNR